MAREALDVLSKDPEERAKAQQVYAYNYKRLYQSASGAWFSFGDEKKMQEALKELARTPYGQNVFANISPRMGLESSNFMPNDQAGFFFPADEKIRLNTNAIDGKMPVADLFHELLHAKQYCLGEMQTKGFSAGQVTVRALVAEAEAEGWDRMHKVMNQAFGSFTPPKEAVIQFLGTDLVAKNRQKQGPSFDEATFKETDPVYRFQQILKSNNGALYRAQRAFVGGEILACMEAFSNPNSEDKNQKWKSYYTSQSMSYALQAMKKGHLTLQGNISEFYHHLDRVASEYGVSRGDLTRLNLSQDEMRVYANIIEVGKKAGFRLAEQNAAGGWQATRVLPSEMIEEPSHDLEVLRSNSRR